MVPSCTIMYHHHTLTKCLIGSVSLQDKLIHHGQAMSQMMCASPCTVHDMQFREPSLGPQVSWNISRCEDCCCICRASRNCGILRTCTLRHTFWRLEETILNSTHKPAKVWHLEINCTAKQAMQLYSFLIRNTGNSHVTQLLMKMHVPIVFVCTFDLG